jgi:hypothetical protein
VGVKTSLGTGAGTDPERTERAQTTGAASIAYTLDVAVPGDGHTPTLHLTFFARSLSTGFAPADFA